MRILNNTGFDIKKSLTDNYQLKNSIHTNSYKSNFNNISMKSRSLSLNNVVKKSQVMNIKNKLSHSNTLPLTIFGGSMGGTFLSLLGMDFGVAALISAGLSLSIIGVLQSIRQRITEQRYMDEVEVRNLRENYDDYCYSSPYDNQSFYETPNERYFSNDINMMNENRSYYPHNTYIQTEVARPPVRMNYDTPVYGGNENPKKQNENLSSKIQEMEEKFENLSPYLKGLVENGIVDINDIPKDSVFKYRSSYDYHQELKQRAYAGKIDLNALEPAVEYAIKNEDGSLQEDFIPYANEITRKIMFQNTERIPGKFGPIYETMQYVVNRDELIGEILKEVKNSSIEAFGEINKNYLVNIIKNLKLELTDSTLISESVTLEKLLSKELKEKLGFKNNIVNMSVEDALALESTEFERHKLFPDLPLLHDIINYDMQPIEVYSYLAHITSDKDFGKKFVKEVQADPKIGNTIKAQIIKKLGGGREGKILFDKWFNDDKLGYRQAYANYYNEEIYGKAESLMDLVKQSPNVAPWAFRQKAAELKIEPTLGELPESFGEIEDFRLLMKEIVKLDKETNSRKYKKNNPDYKTKKHSITLNGRNYELQKLRGGMSAKTKYKITPEGDETYILKFNEYDAIGNTWRSTQIRENQAMRGDSPYLDAMIDFYLRENNCQNAADIKFFDNITRTVMYKATEGKKPNFDNSLYRNLHVFNNSTIANDVNELGVILNDINDGNFIKDSNGQYVLIDTGHAEYAHPFRPMLPGRHISLSNLCGRELR